PYAFTGIPPSRLGAPKNNTFRGHEGFWNCLYIVCSDSGLLWLNVLFLLTVAFLPVPTNGSAAPRPNNRRSLLRAQLDCDWFGPAGAVALWRPASAHHRLVDAKLDAALIAHQTWHLLFAPAIAVLSIGLAFISPYLAEASWLLIGVAIYLHERN